MTADLTCESNPYPLIDIGANLTHQSFASDLAKVLARAQQSNISHMVVTGTDLPDSHAALALAQSHSRWLVATAGIHPHNADHFDRDCADKLKALASHHLVRAIGETGLDFYRDLSSREQQERSFQGHLEMASNLNKPLFLHQRDAHERFVAILREHRQQLGAIVVHCFTDNATALDDYLALDCHIGITGWICDERRGAHLLSCVKRIPLNRLMIETDAPYLMPRTIRPRPKTRRNEPCTLPYVLRSIATARGQTAEEIAAATTQTARHFFAL